MKRLSAPIAVAGTDYFPPELERLCGTATLVLNEHVDDADLCAVYGSAWPCERVQLAEHNPGGSVTALELVGRAAVDPRACRPPDLHVHKG
jgi:hypothetical protein